MRASKLELLYFLLFLLPGLSLIGISCQEAGFLEGILNAFVGFLCLLVALVVLWRWLVFRIELQSRGLYMRQLIWNNREFRPAVLSVWLPYEQMHLLFYRIGPGQKPNLFGIVLKDYERTGSFSELDNVSSPYQEAVLENSINYRNCSTRLLDQRQIKILTADLILRAPDLKLDRNLRVLMGLEQGHTKLRKGYSLSLIAALSLVSAAAVALLILNIANKI